MNGSFSSTTIRTRIGGIVTSLAVLIVLFVTGVHAQDARPATPPQLPAGARPAIESGDPLSQPWTGGRYRLTPSDVIEIRFPHVPEFDQTVTVQPDGYISLRSLGRDLRVQGRSIPEVKALLIEAYVDILREPVINIILKEFEAPYFIAAGEVTRPGKYDLRGATTLTQALALAGGQTREAKHSQVLLFRRFSTELLEVKEIDVKKMYAERNLSEDPLLRPGDTIFIPRSTMAKIAPFIPRASFGFYLNPLQ